METTVTVETPDDPPVETPPVEAPPVTAVVVAPTPEAPTDLAVMVGELRTQMTQVAEDTATTRALAESARLMAEIALQRTEEPLTETPTIEEVVTPPVVVEADPVTPKGKRHWLAEVFL